MPKARGDGVRTQWGRVTGSVHSYKVQSGTRWGFKINGPKALTLHGDRPYQEHKGGYTTQSEALDKLTNRLEAIREGNLSASSELTLGDLFAKFKVWFVEKYGPEKDATARRYETTLRLYAFPWFKDRKVADVVPYLSGHYTYLREHGSHSHGSRRRSACPNPAKCKAGAPLKSNTVLAVDTALRSLFSYATIELRLFGVTPMASVRRPGQQESREIKTWDAALTQHAIKALAGDEYFVAYMLVLLIGLRPGEVAGLRWSQIDWDSRIITVNNQITTAPGITKLEKAPKWRSDRRIKMGDVLYEILSRHRADQEVLGEARDWTTRYVVCNIWTGESLTVNYVSYRWRRALKLFGLPHIPMHGGRHSFATLLKELGVSLDRIGEALGHRFGSKATAVYLHATTDGSAVAIDALDDALRTA